MYKVFYAEVDNHIDIKEHRFTIKKLARDFIDELMYQNEKLKVKKDRVYLITINTVKDEDSDIFITTSTESVKKFFRMQTLLPKNNVIHLHEYESYESAYSVALGMKENTTALAYDKD